jgi:hypothetical protein
MTSVLLHLPRDVHEALWRHLLPSRAGAEEAAFVFARLTEATVSRTFEYVEWFPVPPDGFASHSRFHLELSDATRAAVIKRAHDLGASLIEFHSHDGPWPAGFSASDWAGFEEFVPHVWWRLRGRPYAAVVVASTGFDALVWLHAPDAPTRLDAIIVDGKHLEPTRRSPLQRDGYKFDEQGTI